MKGLRLTERGDAVLGVLVVVGIFGATWLASALGYLLTGVKG